MELKDWFETIYYFSGIILAIGVLVGIKQFKIAKDEIKLLKKDYEVRNKRASIEKSIEYLNLFAVEFIPKAANVLEGLEEKSVQIYKGPINPEFMFDQNCKEESKYIRDFLKAAIECDAISLLNRLEYFSAAFVSGLADEELAFNPLASVFCDYIEDLYAVLCYLRKDDSRNAYQNIVSLYSMWKKRLEKTALEKRRSKLDEEISKIHSESIRYIGAE